MADDGTKIFLYGVSASCPRDLLEDEFEKFGKVHEVFNSGKGLSINIYSNRIRFSPVVF